MSSNDEYELPQLNDPKVAQKVRKVVEDLSNLETMKRGYADKIKEAIKAASEEHDIPKKILREMVRAYYRQTFQTQVEENEMFRASYSKIFTEEAQ